MKMLCATSLLASTVLFGVSTTASWADNPSENKVNGVVVNSTYTFTNVGESGTTATLDQTTSFVPPVTLQLVLTSLTYENTQDTYVGTGVAPSITFDMAPTVQMAGNGNLPSTQVTLYAPVIPLGQKETDVVFSLQSPVSFLPPQDQMTPGNEDQGTSTFGVSISNLEATPAIISLSGATLQSGQPIQDNGIFTSSGTLEIVYAVPEPHAGWLALLAGLGFAGAVVVRRRTSRAGL